MAIDHAASGEVIDIRPLGSKLTESISTALFKSSQLEVLRLVLQAGKTVPEHQVPGEMTIQCLEGSVELRAHARTQVLQAGHLMRLAGNVPYEIHAIDNASLLITITLMHEDAKVGT
ncbi:MAG TPA: cupin [Paucimonas sp.]|nr:cupin [Paucimonas sp.]